LPDHNACELDDVLADVLRNTAADWVEPTLNPLGAAVGSEHYRELGRLANANPPELKTFDPTGRRIDEVEYHPAYHELMKLGMEHGAHAVAWLGLRPGGHLTHVAMIYLLTQAEAGVCCPITMTHAAIPALRRQPDIAAVWEPRVLRTGYDPRCLPAAEKRGTTFGMAMTEKQGGSDVKANTTDAQPAGGGGPGTEYRLTGHKWFCSAPMSDAFLTLARTAGGLSCFLVPRWLPDGTRNTFLIQRLKNKLGNKSNASGEIEYANTYALMVGDEGRGVPTIIQMVQQTRLDAATAPPGLMRRALTEALHHAEHRAAFGRKLIEQPLMRNVLADLALEWEAATRLVLRIAQAFDRAGEDPAEDRLTRIGTAVAKYWTNKRTPEFIYEAMECLGGNGYVEESILPRLYREAPVNSIWEGSGNVICLDVLRAMERDPATADALLEEIAKAAGGHRDLDAAALQLRKDLADPADPTPRARTLTESMAIALQASLMVRCAPNAAADAFCASRLGGQRGFTYGSLKASAALDGILDRARFAV